MGLKSISPQKFGELHRKMMEESVGTLAKEVGSKAVSDKLLDAARGAKATKPDIAALYDNLSSLPEIAGRRSVPLKDVYVLDEKLAAEAAEVAAATTGGKLTPLSARFLAHEFRAEYEMITGEKIDDKAGVARPGVKISGSAKDVKIDIDFNEALAGQTAKSVVLGQTDRVVIRADRLDPPVADPSLPPYWIVISPREGKNDGVWLKDDSGMRGFDDPTNGHLIRAGSDQVSLVDYNAKKTYAKLTFNLDAVNDLGSAGHPTTDATKKFRAAWEKHFDEATGQFDFDQGLASGKLQEITLAEARKVKGSKTLFSAIREAEGGSITKLHKEGLLRFIRDPATQSLAVARYTEGEADHRVSLVDEKKGRWLGTFRVQDDGTKEWNER